MKNTIKFVPSKFAVLNCLKFSICVPEMIFKTKHTFVYWDVVFFTILYTLPSISDYTTNRMLMQMAKSK